MKAFLALEDGSVYRGRGMGAPGMVCAEVCFNTSMTGYQEILTDPSYKAQIVTMTYPLIGNCGVNEMDAESWRAHLAGFVVRELSPMASNWRAQRSLGEYLAEQGVPGLQGVDTRALTKKLRVAGAMKGCLVCGESETETAALERAVAWKGLIGVDYVREVTHAKGFEWDEDSKNSGEFCLASGTEASKEVLGLRKVLPPADIPIVALDLGMKYNILRRLRQHGFRPYLMPAGASTEEILSQNPEGVFLSNGPGDPAAAGYVIENVKRLMDRGLPMFGICLGHQILGLALGGKTYKLKFGHRGANQPVKDLSTGRIEITAQNHGFALESDSLPGNVEVDRVNLNDGTVEGLRHKDKPLFGVQYHPEASPGPHDSTPLFQEFRSLIEGS